jgi:hypothetical protein
VVGTFVDHRLVELTADSLHAAAATLGRLGNYWVLLEHKSTSDRWVLVQLLVYTAQLYDSQRKSGQYSRQPLPRVIPIVVYNGIRRWNSPTEFKQMLCQNEELSNPHLNFGFILLDVGRIPDAAMPRHAELRAGLMALKYGPHIGKRLGVVDLILEALRGTSRGCIEATLAYIVLVSREEHVDAISEKAHRIIPEEVPMFRTIADAWWEDGKAEGKAEGKADTLIRQLTRRFGTVSPSARQQIRLATEPQLDGWLEQVLDARSVDSVLASECTHGCSKTV